MVPDVAEGQGAVAGKRRPEPEVGREGAEKRARGQEGLGDGEKQRAAERATAAVGSAEAEKKRGRTRRVESEHESDPASRGEDIQWSDDGQGGEAGAEYRNRRDEKRQQAEERASAAVGRAEAEEQRGIGDIGRARRMAVRAKARADLDEKEKRMRRRR